MEGTVKFYREDKGYGFIVGDDNQDYFVHATAINNYAQLEQGDNVSFEVTEGDRGPKAVNVTKLGASIERI